MDTKTAVNRGIRRGLEIMTNPNADRLHELQEQAKQRDLLRESWNQVGQALSSAMGTTTSR